jgi:hypothetical protein
MSTSDFRPFDGRWPTRRVATLAVAAVALVAGLGLVGPRGGMATTQKAAALQGMGVMTGTVTAARPFRAAQVYLYNADKHIMYMVYTSGGAFRAVALLPGNYELTIRGRGLEASPQKLVVKAGDNPAVTVALHDTANKNSYPSSVDPVLARSANGVLPPKEEISVASYEEIYPPGPGRVVLETLCMNCHGENYLPLRPRSAAGWRSGLDRMMGKALGEKDKGSFGEGTLAGSVSNFRFGVQDRKDVLEYLTKNFGLDKKPRAVRTDKEIPLDEAQLAKAQYVE